MEVQAQFAFGGLAGYLLPGGGGGLADEQMQALLSAAAGNRAHQYKYNCAAGVASAAQSEMTCNGAVGVVPPSRKRGRDAEHEQYESSSPAAAGALVPELRQHGAEIDALVRAECDRLRAGLEQARKRQCVALARAAAAAAAPAMRVVEAELAAARRRAAGLEELLRQAAAESQAWCGLARSNGAVAAGLRDAIDAVLLQGAGAVEGFGDSGGTDDDDARSCCGAEAVHATTATASSSSSWNGKWACRACGAGEASVLLLPCRHLCVCKACEPRTDACPVCSGAKNASIHVAPPN